MISRCIPAAALLLSLLGAAACAAAVGNESERASNSPAVTAVRLEQVGFDGYYKLGRWTPAVVRVEAAAPSAMRLVARAPDPEGCPTAIPYPARLDTAGTHAVRALFKNGRIGGRPAFEVVELDADGHPVQTLPVPLTEDAAIRPALPQSAFLVAVLGDSAGFDEAPDSGPGASGSPVAVAVARLDSAGHLPTAAAAFESLDVLIVARDYDLEETRSAAVRQWVQLGGHLIVAVGADVAEYAESSLGRWISGGSVGGGGDGSGGDEAPLPLAAAEPVTLRELTALESFSGQRIPIEISRRDGVPAASFDPGRGTVIVRGRGDLPLVTRAPYGFGRITIIAVDVHRPPVSEWAPIAAVMSRLTGLTELAQGPGAATQTGRLAHSGVTDLASQLARAQRAFPEVRRSSLWTVIGLLIGYLLVIGPVDYFVVHRLLGRPHLTWVTFPLLVAAAAVLAGWTARRTNGEEVRINHLDLVDVEGQFQTVRARSWLTLYTPETRRFALAAHPALMASPDDAARAASSEVREALVSWSGTPENVFGGMYRAGGLEAGRPPYEFDADAVAIRNLPLSLWATRDVEAQWHTNGRPVVESELTRTTVGQLRGRLTHHLPGTIHDWIVAVGRRVYIPAGRGDAVPLEAGTAWPADARWESLPQRELTAWLTGTVPTRVIRSDGTYDDKAEGRPTQRKYNPFDAEGVDPAEAILRMITFHRAAGGKAYTGLDNHGFRREELTELLDSGRAVLFGRIDFAATEFQINGEPVEDGAARRSAFVRIVLPLGATSR